MPAESKREKNWKHLYLRSVKLARAKQLGVEYPRATEAELQKNAAAEVTERLNVLFICSRNQWRSPTAEQVWRNHPALAVRSAGTSPNARRHVSEQDLRWAEAIFVMEEKHKSRLIAEFGRIVENKPVHVLDIPDEYKYMDPELVEELKRSVGSILGLD
jgi:predicted protein tyrosine phosphatase